MNRHRCLAALVSLVVTATACAADAPAWSWYEVDRDRNVRVNLYLFWSSTCPHCAQALDFVNDLKARHPWLTVHTYEITGSPENRDLYRRMAAGTGQPAGQTPAFLYGKRLVTGYNSHDTTGRALEQALVNWHNALEAHFRKQPPPSAALPLAAVTIALLSDLPDEPVPDAELPPELADEAVVRVPLWGEVRASDLSLPALTAVLAACDSVNPCAFFVLLFLLSLLIHGRSRARMALVGGTFVFFSGLVYFLFMAAWLNLFFVVGHLRLITLLAGLVALAAAAVNIKDFFWFKRGFSLSMPESVKPGLHRRMTRLINVTGFASLLGATVALSALVNLYELLCTAGFPLVYTRVLTLRQLPTTTYYSYLVLYNVIYVVPLALIVLAFTVTLGRRKLSEYEGRVLKLLSGVMMFLLGLVLVAAPQWLNTVVGAVGMLVLAVALTAAIVLAERHYHGSRTPART